MADSTSIEWTDATWNPVTGCTKISAGCDHCYAERFSERFRGTPEHPFENGFDLTLRPERLEQPISWRRSRMIFVNSMSDLFHKEIPRDFIARVFDTMEGARWHTFQVLTKRSSLMRDFLRRRYGSERGPHHMWFGVSVEDGSKKSRIRHLQEAPAGVRFLPLTVLAFVVAPKHRLAKRKHVPISELGEENFIAHNVLSPYREIVLRVFRVAVVRSTKRQSPAIIRLLLQTG